MGKRVLLIDDEWAIVRALTVRLGAAGFEVTAASDGASGLAAAEATAPDAILLDLRMPDMDGFEVNRRLRANVALAATPVIFLSANVHDSARQAAFADGAAGFFTKPYDYREVVKGLEHAIEVACLRKEVSLEL